MDTDFIVPTLALLIMGGLVVLFYIHDKESGESLRASRMAIDEIARLRIANIELGRVISEYDGLTRKLLRQLESLGIEPVARPNGIIRAAERGEKPLQELHTLIEECFNLEGLNSLAFRLGIDYENISGETKKQRVLSLIDYCNDRGLLQELVALCIELRPKENWPKIP